MPATSKAQQALFGIAHAIQTGKRSTKGVSDPAKKIAKTVSKKDVKDFASTPTKGLPKRKPKKENKLVSFIRNEVQSALREGMEWPYFTLKDGFLFDEGGDKVEGTPQFKDSGEAEDWLENSNMRGSVKEGIPPSLSEIVKELPPEKKHQLAIAYRTLKMPDAMVGVMGGPNKEQARQIIKMITGHDYKERKESFDSSKVKKNAAITAGRAKAQKDPQAAYAQYKMNVKDKANAMPYEKWYAQWKETNESKSWQEKELSNVKTMKCKSCGADAPKDVSGLCSNCKSQKKEVFEPSFKQKVGQAHDTAVKTGDPKKIYQQYLTHMKGTGKQPLPFEKWLPYWKGKQDESVDYYDLKVGKKVKTDQGTGTITHVNTGSLSGAVEVKLDNGKTITVQGRKLKEEEQVCGCGHSMGKHNQQTGQCSWCDCKTPKPMREGLGKYTCANCGADFKNMPEYVKHVNKCNSEELNEGSKACPRCNTIMDKATDPEGTTYKCPSCGKKISSKTEGLFGGGGGGAKLPAKFRAKLERKIAGGKTVDFDCSVEGYFEGAGKKPKFIASKITVDGIPQMNIRNMYPGEIQSVNDYAINTIYPKMLGIKKEGKLHEATSMTADKLMQIDGKVWDKLHIESGGELRDNKTRWNEYVKVLGQLLKGIAPVSQSTLLKLENENHHSLMQALGQLGLVDPKAPYYKGLTKSPMTKFEGKEVQRCPDCGKRGEIKGHQDCQYPQNEGILREVVQELIKEESEAAKKAKSMGLDYMGFGRYGKKGKQSHAIENGKLVPFTDKDNRTYKERDPKTLKPVHHDDATGPGDIVGRNFAKGGPQADTSKTPTNKNYTPGKEVDDKALNFWRDIFKAKGAKLSADAIKKLRQSHPSLNLAFNDLASTKQLGGAYIKKLPNGDWVWPEMTHELGGTEKNTWDEGKLNEGSIGKLSGDASDVLDGIVYKATQRRKTPQQILPFVKNDSVIKPEIAEMGISDRELLSYIKDSSRMFGGPNEGKLNELGTGVVSQIRNGDRVTIKTRFGKEVTGKARIFNREQNLWVLNMGGTNGTPGLADEENIVSINGKKV